jgi:uncharacterized protein YndB with AHSA1/START domain
MDDVVLTVRAEELIAASPIAVYDLVSDLTRMGEWSPENQGAEWIEGEPRAVGSRFLGRNRNGDVEWEGGGIVIASSPPHEFAWVMGDDPACPRGTWRYVIEKESEAVTRVTETYELGPGESGFRDEIEALPPADRAAALRFRRTELEDGMRTTLRRIKARTESERGPA